MTFDEALAKLLGVLTPDALLSWAERTSQGHALSARLEAMTGRARVQTAATALKWEREPGAWVALLELLPAQAETIRALAEKNGVELDELSCPSASELVGASPEVSALSARLQDAFSRLQAAGERGEDEAPIRAEILEIRRLLRAGPALVVGDLLGAGRYRLTERLGHGGFATVWAAWDRELRRSVALKVLHAQHAHDADRRDRFFRGARLMADLHHEGVVRVLDPRREDEGHHYFVMERLAGGDLCQAVRAGRLDREQALAAVLEVGAALSFAHARQVIHRDVKPQNILLDPRGRATLTDFDLVKAADTTGGTRSGALGTFLYAAPEAMRSANTADPRADVFSLAMTAVFCVHGADIPAEALYEREAFLQSLDCTEALRSVLTRGTAIKVDARYPTVEAFCVGLREALLAPAPALEAQEEVSSPRAGSRYAPLQAYLAQVADHVETTTMTFAGVEAVLGAKLPLSARRHRPWWANNAERHVHARAWLESGWKVAALNVTKEQVTFARVEGRSAAYIAFFNRVIAEVRRQHPGLEPFASPNGKSSHALFSLNARGQHVGVVAVSFARSAQLRIEAYLSAGGQAQTKALYRELHGHRARIEGSLDLALTWEPLEDRVASRVAFYLPARLDDSPERLDWLVATSALHAGNLYKVLRPLLS